MLSERQWKPDALMMLAAGVMLSWCTGQLITLQLQRWLPQTGLDHNFLRFTISTLSFQGAAVVLIHQFLRWHDLQWRDILLGREQRLPKVIATGLGVGLLVVPLTLAMGHVSSEVIRAVQLPVEEQMAVKVVEKTVEPMQRLWFFLAAVVLVPVAEETLFRGIMYPCLKQYLGPWLAVTITSVVFSAIHLNLMAFVPLIFLACVLTWLYERTDSLLTPILTHAIFNGTNLYMLLYPPDLPRWLHGRV